MSDEGARVPRLLCIGAHPDDCEIKTSGLAALWTGNGGAARFVAMTDGGAGHQELAGAKLVEIRRAEARAGAAVVGADSLVFDNPDGSLMPSLENRHKVIRAVREFQPDVIVTHRTNDYHPDHRYTGVLVQDACYMIMVPNVLPIVPVPARAPVVLFMSGLKWRNGCPGSTGTWTKFPPARSNVAAMCGPAPQRLPPLKQTASAKH
jgi:LmbE family N-acetylglucosaminyl deacetylase